MKIAVLGATGPSGIQVIKEALEREHEITAIVRNPDKLTENHENLKVVKANIFDAESLVPHLTGQDAVLSCLGCTPSWLSLWTVTFYMDSVKPVVTALRRANVNRFIFMSSWYTKNNSGEPFFMKWIIKPLFLGQSLKNMGEMEDYLEIECPDIDYTSVRAPQLSHSATTGTPVKYNEGQHVSPVSGFIISRRDVAKFMLDAAESGNFRRKCMAIGSG
ncbi:flavin reductase (NADPH)-like [Mercenaria mercenaria]|uniref:flavin reductase (NADPH)-like n=1 Tax=Mercenaria mercenaria TaxID=6596 RepID=UPI00234E3AC3|nr:flavin reductase (NADPH)-like [Mercenaria mercenaria]